MMKAIVLSISIAALQMTACVSNTTSPPLDEAMVEVQPQGGKFDREESSLTFLTYNTGLAHGAVELAIERLPYIGEAIRERDADVVCLQEVWESEDRDALLDILGDVYPHSFAEETFYQRRNALPQCNPLRLLSVKSCVDACIDGGDSPFECVDAVCADEYAELGDSCQRCIGANATTPQNCALPASRSIAYDGRNGLMLLSKRPLHNVQYTSFHGEDLPVVLARGFISAGVDDIRVRCTHLSAHLLSVPFADDHRFSSWVEQQEDEIDQIAFGADLSDTCEVVMGDLNTSPETDGVDGEIPEHFDRLLGYGFTDGWQQQTRQCTYCPSNPLASGEVSLQLDHILFSPACGEVTGYERTLDELVDVVSADGSSQLIELSDHYGMIAALRR